MSTEEAGASTESHRDIRIIAVPYDSGHPGVRMGAGPGHLLARGLGEELRSGGQGVATVRHENEPAAEVATAFELHGRVSDLVRQAIAGGGLPLILSGNCNLAAVGAVAGAGPGDLGIVWFDAHADFNTPETTTTGFTDGMGLAIAVGHCWKGMAGAVPGFSAVPEPCVVMVGTREIEPAEQKRLDASEVTVVDGAEKRVLEAALDDLRTRVGRIYLHLDLDVLDAARVGKANQFAVGGGLDGDELQAALGAVRERFEVAAAGIASYDPSFDAADWVLQAAITSAKALTRPPSYTA